MEQAVAAVAVAVAGGAKVPIMGAEERRIILPPAPEAVKGNISTAMI
jgi:hypothetical protein